MSHVVGEFTGRLVPRYGPRIGARQLVMALALVGALVAAAEISWPGAPAAPASPAAHHPAASGLAAVPPLAQLAISRGIGADERAFWALPDSTGAVVHNPNQHFVARFGRGRVAIAGKAGEVGIRLDAVLAGDSVLASGASAAAPTLARNRVTYGGGEFSQWYANGPMGLEQGFLIARPAAAGAGPLTVKLDLSGSLRPRIQRGTDAVSLIGADGRVAMRYGRLSASDVTGRKLPVSMALDGRRLLLRVNTTGASYPVTVDPLVEEGQLSGSNGGLGTSVAVSGSTIVVGSPVAAVAGSAGGKVQGAVYVFTEPAGGWADATQTAELIASDADTEEGYEDGRGYELGNTVAISGNTIVASAPGATAGHVDYAGKIYVYVKPEGGEWVNSSETAQLSASDAGEYHYLGSGLATDGNTVVAGQVDEYEGLAGAGALYVFSKAPSGWKSELQTAKLTASGSYALGWSVAVNGSTIFGGAPFTTVNTKSGAGAVYEYSETERGGWTTTSLPTAELTSGGPAYETLGTAVGLEGATLVAGAANDYDPGQAPSSAYVFTESMAGWQDTEIAQARLTPSDPASYEHFGESAAISGSEIAIGTQFAGTGVTGTGGAVYLYQKPVTGWESATQTQKLWAGGGNIRQAGDLALSGSTLVTSAPYATSVKSTPAYGGVAYVFGTSGPGTEKSAGSQETPKETTFVKPAEGTHLTYTSTAPKVTYETFIGFPLNVPPGQAIGCSGNECTCPITCRTKSEPCIGSATFEEVSGALASSVGTVANTNTKAKAKRKPLVLGTASFNVASGHRANIAIKLTAAARRLLKGKKQLRVRLVIKMTHPAATTPSSVRTITIKLSGKK